MHLKRSAMLNAFLHPSKSVLVPPLFEWPIHEVSVLGHHLMRFHTHQATA